MGQGASSSLRLEEVSVEALALLVEGLGPKYSRYGGAVRENAVDGEILNSLAESSFQETLEDLEVNRLHQRVLTKEWVKWKERDRQPVALASRGGSAATKRPPSNKDIARALAKKHPELILEHHITLSEEERQDLVDAAASYEFIDETPASELIGFDRLAAKAIEQCKALFAGVHLLEDDGHYVLGERFYSFPDGEIHKDRIHAPREISRCYGVVLGETSDFVAKELDPGKCPFQVPGKRSRYVAHVLHTPDNKRIGVICAIVDKDGVDEEEGRCAILKDLAAEAEDQLRLRRTLLKRTKMLLEQIHQLKMSKESTVLSSFGPVRAITQEDLERRGPSPYPMPDELAASGKTRNTADLPYVQASRATSEQMSHLPENFYAMADAMGAVHPPIAKDDQERVSVVEALRLHELTHDNPSGIALHRLVTLGGRLFNIPFAEISFQNHSDYYSFARYTSWTEEQKDRIDPFYHTINTDDNGEPWLRCLPENGRCISLCIYTTATKRTLTIHDVWNDESFRWIGEHNGYKFYSGCPVFVNGRVVATFCMMDFVPRNDFTRAHEMQQEQIAILISQQIESWALRRDMERLEEERRRLEIPLQKAAPPVEYAALVLTDIQGSTPL